MVRQPLALKIKTDDLKCNGPLLPHTKMKPYRYYESNCWHTVAFHSGKSEILVIYKYFNLDLCVLDYLWPQKCTRWPEFSRIFEVTSCQHHLAFNTLLKWNVSYFDLDLYDIAEGQMLFDLSQTISLRLSLKYYEKKSRQYSFIYLNYRRKSNILLWPLWPWRCTNWPQNQ